MSDKKAVKGNPVNPATGKPIRLLNGWAFIEEYGAENPTKGKVLMPQGLETPDHSQKGKVIGLCHGHDKNLRINDIVLFRLRVKGRPLVNVFGQMLRHMKEDHILGVMFGENAADVKPLRDNLLLDWEFTAEVFPGTNLIRPDNFKEMQYTGIVLAAGPDVDECKVGERVFFDQFCMPEKFQENEKRFAFVSQKDLITGGLEFRKKKESPAKPVEREKEAVA